MASVASQLIEGDTAHVQRDSLEDAREICADGTYFPNNLRIMSRLIKFNSFFWFLLDPVLTAGLHFMYNKLSEAEYRHCVKLLLTWQFLFVQYVTKNFYFGVRRLVFTAVGVTFPISRQFTHGRTGSGVD